MHRNKHRFTILLPFDETASSDLGARQRRIDLARRVAELEKPAHTTFTIQYYWALFRVGGVRVGYDTVIGEGSRAPQLMTSLVLGRGYVMESYLASSQPTRRTS